ncbi:N(2)-acetyl-L-2,4-diaminobutanoate deacetylase DoeB2 [Aurantivibrio plasticivorans]
MSNEWQENIEIAKAFRRTLHQHPELSWQEYNTAASIREMLDELRIPWRPCAETGTVAWINPEGSKPAIALRADIDALPIDEKTGKAWQSTAPGCMHACGHDGHTATLFAAARWLKFHEHELDRCVVLLFQPAEEGGHGAREMIADGALDDVSEIYGWHNWPALPYGTLACPDDLIMCGNGTFTIHLRGEGGHASQPERCKDPVLAASAITLALQQICSRRLPPQKAAVISITRIHTGNALTVIPETADIGGSIRVPDEETRATIKQLITEIAMQTAESYGVSCEVDHQARYGATVNHATQAATARACWTELYGSEGLAHGQQLPIMASEDFSYYLREKPGAFALIGSDDGKGHDAPCHSPHYDFNDQLISDVCRWFCRLTGMRTPP